LIDGLIIASIAEDVSYLNDIVESGLQKGFEGQRDSVRFFASKGV
jgi:hypothetical protein